MEREQRKCPLLGGHPCLQSRGEWCIFWGPKIRGGPYDGWVFEECGLKMLVELLLGEKMAEKKEER